MVAVRGALPVEGEMLHSAAAFLPGGLVEFVGEEMFQRGEKEGAELASFSTESFEVVLLEEALEECLHQVFSVFFRVTAPADIRIERVPVGLAQLGQGCI